MAGAFTHMAVVGNALESFPPGKKFGDILRTYRNFLTLGSVSPDIPYLGHLALKGPVWADIMHYYNTNGIINNGVHSLSVAQKKGKDWECQLAWLAGFIAHLVADATIHPIVECIAGPYTDADSRSTHSECEMIQDVMIFKEVMNIDLVGTEWTNLLRTCTPHKSFEKVAAFWTNHAKVNCPFVEKFDSGSIIKSYIDELDTVDSIHGLAAAFRHLGINYVYRTYSDLKKNSPELVDKYYYNVRLPNGRTGSFKTEGFERSVKHLSDVWSKLDRFLFSIDNIPEIIPNWNLDTGVDQNKNIVTYWS